MARVRTIGVTLLAVGAGFGAFMARGDAQTPPPSITLPGLTTTTTTTTVPSSSSDPGGGGSSSSGSPDGGSGGTTSTTIDVSGDGDNGSPVGGGPGQTIPPDAQAIINSLVRSGANDDHLLVSGEKLLLGAGVDPDQAARLAYGRFPVAGPAAWVDDWYAPRWTGTEFRFHLGVDLIAAYGTPLRAPADGIARIDNSPLGGLSVKVVQPDGTFFYLAHMSATAEGLVDGKAVHVGDLLGYVGMSGDATGPHCHFGIYERGVTAIPPKPYVDQWVAEQSAQLPSIISSVTGRSPLSLLSGAARRLMDDGVRAAASSGGPSRTDLLFATSASPFGGALQLAQASAAHAAGGVDWAQRATLAEAYQRAWDQAVVRARTILDPLTPEDLRPR